MEFKRLNHFYVLTKIKEHSENKKEILKHINNLDCGGLTAPAEKTSKSDWCLDKDVKREYSDLFIKILRPYLDQMVIKMKFDSWRITNMWFQQYQNKDYHMWHNHPDCNWANVYYLDLPVKKMATEFFDLKDNKIMDDIEVQEGDLLTFPAGILHRSPVNESNKSKTSIAFNSNFYVANQQVLP